ncbi:MAG TPA: DUF3040 domain-containing protein [Jatrophihabitantaceae bacterium]|jgi:hypothetical protein
MSLSEHEQQVLDAIERDLTNVAADGHLPSGWRRPGRLARAGRGGALVVGVLLIGVGLVHPSAAGEAIAVAGYLVLVGALSAVLDARRRYGLRPAWSRLWRLLASRSTTPQRGDDSGPAEPA